MRYALHAYERPSKEREQTSAGNDENNGMRPCPQLEFEAYVFRRVVGQQKKAPVGRRLQYVSARTRPDLAMIRFDFAYSLAPGELPFLKIECAAAVEVEALQECRLVLFPFS